MRTYGTIRNTFWADAKDLRLSRNATLLAAFLQTSPHTNSTGCFRLPVAYLMDDLSLSHEEATAALGELEKAAIIVRCHVTNWTLIINFLRDNRPANTKVGKSMIPLIEAVPVGTAVWFGLVDGVSLHADKFPEGYVIRLLELRDTVSRQVRETVSETVCDTVSPVRSDTVCQTVCHTVERNSGTHEHEHEHEPFLTREDVGGDDRGLTARGGVH
ncbi:hypothetical protein J2847_002943 [Azospirillum agricola]|uniref:hypothetical protein n=1 Tax=Azospirillum agricola TaxID=1720247 RepID=UPI001AE27E5F|nr:hypothetical protein [Azospirillum agricola]MBP2229644.1 hypothetical protein [Azospirillum agricola]